MSTYGSVAGVPTPDGATFFDVAADCFGRDVRIIAHTRKREARTGSGRRTSQRTTRDKDTR